MPHRSALPKGGASEIGAREQGDPLHSHEIHQRGTVVPSTAANAFDHSVHFELLHHVEGLDMSFNLVPCHGEISKWNHPKLERKNVNFFNTRKQTDFFRLNIDLHKIRTTVV